jgi:WD40 repeat protein
MHEPWFNFGRLAVLQQSMRAVCKALRWIAIISALAGNAVVALCAAASDPSPQINFELPQAHATDLRNYVVSSDSKHALTLDYNGVAIHWDVSTGQSLGALPFQVEQIAISPSSPWVFLLTEVSGDHLIVVYDLGSSSEVDRLAMKSLKHDRRSDPFITDMYPSADGRTLLVGLGLGAIGLIDRRERTLVTITDEDYSDGSIDVRMVSNDHHWLAAAVSSEGKPLVLKLWNLLSGGEPIATQPCPTDVQSCDAGELAFTDDGARLIFRLSVSRYTANGDERYSTVIGALATETGAAVWSREASGAAFGLPGPGSGAIVLSQQDHYLTLDPLTGHETEGLPAGYRDLAGKLSGLKLLPVSSTAIISQGVNKNEYTKLLRWHDGAVHIADLSGWSLRIVAAQAVVGTSMVALLRQDGIDTFDLNTGRIRLVARRENVFHAGNAAFTADGSLLIWIRSGNSTPATHVLVDAIATADGKTVWSTRVEAGNIPDSTAFSFAEDNEGLRLAVFFRDTADDSSTTRLAVHAFDRQTGMPLWHQPGLRLGRGGSHRRYRGVTSPSSSDLWITSNSSEVTRLSWKDGFAQTQRFAEINQAEHILFASRGNRALVDTGYSHRGDSSTVALDTATLRILEPVSGVPPIAAATRVSADSFIIGSTTGEVIEANVRQGIAVRRFPQHPAAVTGVAAFPDLKRLVTASSDGTLLVSNLTSGTLVAKVLLGFNGSRIIATIAGFVDGDDAPLKVVGARVEGERIEPGSTAMTDLVRPDIVRNVLSGQSPERYIGEFEKLRQAWRTGGPEAPSVIIDAPLDGHESRSGIVAVSASIIAGKAGIGTVRISINGHQLAVDRTAARGATPLGAMQLERVLQLEAGENIIEVTATDATGRFLSRPARVTVVALRSGQNAPALHILTLRLEHTKTGAVRDGLTHVADRLAEQAKGLFRVVERHTTDGINGPADRARPFLGSLLPRIEPQDAVIVLVQAQQESTTAPITNRHPDSSRAPIEWDELLAQLPARKVLFVANFVRSQPAAATVAERGLADVAALDRLTRAVGRASLIAMSSPSSHGSDPQGFFDILGRVLEAADSDGDGIVTVVELVSAVERELSKRTEGSEMIQPTVLSMVRGADFPVSRAAIPLHQQLRDRSATHVIHREACLRPLGESACSTRLQAGFRLRIISVLGAEALVARDGRDLGYVRLESLAPLQ